MMIAAENPQCLVNLTSSMTPTLELHRPVKQKPRHQNEAKLVRQFFFSSLEGAYCCPVASFPLRRINHCILSTLAWLVSAVIGSLRIANGEKIEVLYDACDGSSCSHAFFSRSTELGNI